MHAPRLKFTVMFWELTQNIIWHKKLCIGKWINNNSYYKSHWNMNAQFFRIVFKIIKIICRFRCIVIEIMHAIYFRVKLKETCRLNSCIYSRLFVQERSNEVNCIIRFVRMFFLCLSLTPQQHARCAKCI